MACREHALRGLTEHPDDPELLQLAGRASLDLAHDDAVGYLRRLTEVRPDDGNAWRDLGVGLLGVGAAQEAADALDRAVTLVPDDQVARVNLAHVAYAMGDRERAVGLLTEAAQTAPDGLTARRSLLEIHRAAGDLRAALEVAQDIADRRPDDVLAMLDVAHLQLELGDAEAANAGFGRLREHDDEPGHGIFALHGMIEAEARAGRWRRALDRAIEATSLDRHPLTTHLLATAAARLFGESEDRTAPPWEELLQVLAEERSEHRQLHQEAIGG